MKRSIMKGLCLGVVAYACMEFSILELASAYNTVVVTDGAVLRGTVTFQGAAPEPKEFELRRYPDRMFCGAFSDGDGHRFLKEVNVGREALSRMWWSLWKGCRAGSRLPLRMPRSKPMCVSFFLSSPS